MSQDYEPFRLFPYQAIVDRPHVEWPNGARVAWFGDPDGNTLSLTQDG